MSRILLLMIVVLWMCRSAAPRTRGLFDITQGVGLFVIGLLLVVLFMGLWSRVLARTVRGENLHRSLRRFHRSMTVARLLIPIWFGVAIYWLGWGNVVAKILRPIDDWPVELPGMLIGTAPAFLAWVALWWAQYPADRALREQTLLYQLDENLPIHAPPNFWSYVTANLRLQVLFTIVPVAGILLVRDVASILLTRVWGLDPRAALTPGSTESMVEAAVMLGSIGLVILFIPEILRHVLSTQQLPDSPLRRRLEEICRRTRLRYRDILLWKTNHNMGNAAVMGLIPQVRYILLSDVLLETMTDRQIEAVFAHELGHVKHRHMVWYVVLVATLLLLLSGPGYLLGEQLERMQRPAWLDADMLGGIGAIASVVGFLLVFGYLSRWFERQADVFAARLIEHDSVVTVEPALARVVAGASAPLPATFVGPTGAATFAAALKRVALVNNIPLSARNFTHGSIAERVRYLQDLSTDPSRTLQFDRSMSVLYAMMTLALLACGAWVMVAQVA